MMTTLENQDETEIVFYMYGNCKRFGQMICYH